MKAKVSMVSVCRQIIRQSIKMQIHHLLPVTKTAFYALFLFMMAMRRRYGDYILISNGVTIVDHGDAIVTEKGIYKVKVKIKDGYRWEIVDPDIPYKGIRTGDSNDIGLWFALMILSAGALASLVIYRIKSSE